MDTHTLTGNCSIMKRIVGTSVDDSRGQLWTPTSTSQTQPLLPYITGGNTIADQQNYAAAYAVGLVCIIGLILYYLCKRTCERKKAKRDLKGKREGLGDEHTKIFQKSAKKENVKCIIPKVV